MTTTSSSGTLDDTVEEVKLGSDVEEYLSSSNCLIYNSIISFMNGYDSKNLKKLGHSIQDNFGRMIRRNLSVGMSTGSAMKQPYAVIDSGAEEDLVGGRGWYIQYISDQTETLNGALSGMGSITLPKVDAITAVNDKRGNVVLLGFGNLSYDRRIAQNESLLNSHHLRRNGVQVNDIAKQHNGKQNIEVSDGQGGILDIPLKFDGDIVTLDLREPTEEELATLSVVWIRPAMETESQSIRRSRRRVERNQVQQVGNNITAVEEKTSVQDSVNQPTKEVKFGNDKELKNWKELLGFPNDEVVEKTLETTTQFCSEPIEMERREIPRQHRKKRLFPLHPRRLNGRVDADTFFSSVESIRKYKCVQFFVHVKSDFVFGRCMQRESHSHGAYQDFIREVGAPQMIVTDNSKTQTGKLWQATSRKIMTKQNTFAPHNQNQNKAERRIQDAKHKTMTVLYHAGAPLIFWCYALMHVIDCMNHIAKKSLGWRTSYEIMNGDTPDISAFRFTFWQQIEYFDPTARFPDSQWKEGRFLGIAWNSGDQFTFKIWTEENGNWKQGRELIRNIVRPRRRRRESNEIATKDDYSEFKFQKMVPIRKRKRGSRTIVGYRLQDLEILKEDDKQEEIVENDVDFRSVRFQDHPIVPGTT